MPLRAPTISRRFLTRTGLVLNLCTILHCVTAFDYPQTQLQLQTGCDPLPFTAETWKKLELDKYVTEYPNGYNLTVSEYAANVGAYNFKCGLAEWCNAGQMCYPVKGLDWYVLFAIQEWNERMNTFNTAIGFSMSLVQANLLSIASSLFPQPNNLHIFSQKTHFAMGAALASLLIGLLSLIPFFVGMPSITLTWIAGLVLVPASIATITSVATRYKDVPHDSFTLSSILNYQFTKYQEQIQDALRNQTHSLLNTGISRPEGMAGALTGGSFLDPRNFPSLEKMETELRNITLGASVSHILKSMNAFITIGSDACTSSGKNGAWSGDDVLSFCNSNGTMFNIITASRGKSHVHNRIPNAQILSTKFGISTEYLVSSAIECDKERKGLVVSNTNTTLASIERGQTMSCIIDLPVCDCRGSDFQEKKKRIGTVKACREAGVSI